MIGRSRSIRLGLRVSSDSLVGDLSDISVVVVRGVLDMLGTAIRKSNGVGSCDNTRSISSLSSVEVSLGVVISNSVLVGIGLVLALGLDIRGRLVSRGGLVRSRGGFVGGRGRGVRCRGRSIGRSSMDDRSMDNRSMDDRSMVGYRVGYRVNSMVSNGVCNRVDSMVGNRVDSVVGDRVDSMVGNGVDSMVSNWVDNWSMMSNPKMRSMAAMRHNSTMTMTDYMGRHIRSRSASPTRSARTTARR